MNLINLNEYIVTKISPALISFMSLKLQILPAFRRGVAHFYSFIMWDTRAFFVKLVRNWNVPISSNFAIIWWNRDISISNLLHKKWSGVSHGKAIKMCYTSPESWQNLQFQRHQNHYAMLSIGGTQWGKIKISLSL